MKVLIVDDEKDLLELLSFAVEAEFGEAEIFNAESGEEALEILGDHKIDLVISDYLMPYMDGGKLKEQILSTYPGCAFVFCSGALPEVEHNDSRLFGTIIKPQISEGLTIIANKWRERYNVQGPNDEGMIGISLEALVYLGVMPTEIHMQLGVGKFVKYYSNQDVFAVDDFEKLKQKGVCRLFVKRKDREAFQSYFDKNYQGLSQLNEEEQKTNFRKNSDFMNDALAFYEFSEKAIEQSERWINAAMKALEKDERLLELIQKLLKDPGCYLCAHTSLVSLFCVELALKMDWKNDATLFKLMLAALLHDAKLEGHLDEGAMEELKKEGKREWRDFMEHPSVTAAFVRDLPQLPPDVDRLVMDHHENPQGTGFPKKLSAVAISPLSALFVMAHEISDYVWHQCQNGQKRKLNKALIEEQFSHRFNAGQYRKIWQAYMKDS